MLNLNQFSKGSVIPGQLDLVTGAGENAFTFRINSESSATDIAAGTPVKLVDGGASDSGGVPVVDVVEDASEVSFGAIIYSIKNGKYQPGDIVQVSSRGSVQFFTATAPINRGEVVSIDATNTGQVKAKGGDARFGMTFDKAKAANAVIRVLVDPEFKA